MGFVAFMGVLATGNPLPPKSDTEAVKQWKRDREHRIRVGEIRDRIAYGAIAACIVGTVIGLSNWKTTPGKVTASVGGTLLVLYLAWCMIGPFLPVE